MGLAMLAAPEVGAVAVELPKTELSVELAWPVDEAEVRRVMLLLEPGVTMGRLLVMVALEAVREARVELAAEITEEREETAEESEALEVMVELAETLATLTEALELELELDDEVAAAPPVSGKGP